MTTPMAGPYAMEFPVIGLAQTDRLSRSMALHFLEVSSII
jgi:hypothetical protein